MVSVPLPEAKYVGQAMVSNVEPAARETRLQKHTPLTFLDYNIGNLRRAIHVKLGFAMGKRDVNRVVLQIVDEVARPDISFRPQTFLLEVRIARQGRRFSLP